MALPLPVKLLLFVLLWFEMGRCFALGADAAFLASICVACGTVIVSALGFELAGLEEDLTNPFVAWGIIWLLLFSWLAPEPLKQLPLSFIICAVVALVYLGARAFPEFIKRPELFQKHWLRERSEAVVGCLMGGLATCMVAERRWGSVLPLVGYVALFALPFAFGWRIAARVLTTPYEARFGQRQRFRDANVSEDQ